MIVMPATTLSSGTKSIVHVSGTGFPPPGIQSGAHLVKRAARRPKFRFWDRCERGHSLEPGPALIGPHLLAAAISDMSYFYPDDVRSRCGGFGGR